MSNRRSKPTPERHKGAKSKTVFIATSSIEQHGYVHCDARHGRPESPGWALSVSMYLGSQCARSSSYQPAKREQRRAGGSALQLSCTVRCVAQFAVSGILETFTGW